MMFPPNPMLDASRRSRGRRGSIDDATHGGGNPSSNLLMRPINLNQHPTGLPPNLLFD